MADGENDLSQRVQAVEDRVTQLSASVDQRFNEVDAALLEQRQYTEFGFSRLEAKMDAGFAKMDARLAMMDARLAMMDGGFARMHAGLGRLERLERKMDQFIDAQLQTNELVDRRLRPLE